jgi:hypothetical protein
MVLEQGGIIIGDYGLYREKSKFWEIPGAHNKEVKG